VHEPKNGGSIHPENGGVLSAPDLPHPAQGLTTHSHMALQRAGVAVPHTEDKMTLTKNPRHGRQGPHRAPTPICFSSQPRESMALSLGQEFAAFNTADRGLSPYVRQK
jgi:hypothetical protein